MKAGAGIIYGFLTLRDINSVNIQLRLSFLCDLDSSDESLLSVTLSSFFRVT